MWWVLIIEAGVALFLLVFIVWWTMYSGPKPTNNERQPLPPPDEKKELTGRGEGSGGGER